MKTRILIFCMLILCMGMLTGCWDYRSMDEINIVSGIAVDLKEDDQYVLTLELVNTSGMKDDGGAQSLVVTAEGETMFEAVRNAKKKLYNKLYLGSMRVLIVSQELAEKEGIQDVIDTFLRDMEPRETTFIVVSQEESAGKLMSASGLDTTNISYKIAKVILEDHKVDSATKSVQLFEAYNILKATGVELVLPAIHMVQNGDEEVAEINGLAVFRGDKLTGFLSAEDTRYFLMATQGDTRGALSLPHPEKEGKQIGLEIMQLTSKPEVRYANGNAAITVAVTMAYKTVEYSSRERISGQALETLNGEAERMVAERMHQVFEKIQKNLGVDIYGFGHKLYERQYSVWLGIEDAWAQLFQNAEFDVQVKMKAIDIGLTS